MPRVLNDNKSSHSVVPSIHCHAGIRCCFRTGLEKMHAVLESPEHSGILAPTSTTISIMTRSHASAFPAPRRALPARSAAPRTPPITIPFPPTVPTSSNPARSSARAASSSRPASSGTACATTTATAHAEHADPAAHRPRREHRAAHRDRRPQRDPRQRPCHRRAHCRHGRLCRHRARREVAPGRPAGRRTSPSLGVLLHADLPSGSRELRGHGVRPSLRLAAEWDLPHGYCPSA
jgi:hypothetical protein